jgi:LuxR family maltose regulon positive regulatory protein
MAGIYATPRVPRATVSRARLTELLSVDAPLVVVRAPAGSGKTVAVADWAAQLADTDARGAWFTVDEGTSDRLAFWQGLLQAMSDAELLPRRSILQTSLGALDSSPDLRRLLLRGFAQLRSEVVLVIDDLHLASDPQVVPDLVALLGATPGLKIVALTRLRAELERDTVEISLGSHLIDASTLMFTREETARLIELVGPADDGGALSTALHRAVGGLPLITRGVLLLMQRQEFDLSGDNVQQQLERAGAEVLRDIWAMQVGDDRDVDFVIRCSVPEFLTTELAIRLTGREDASVVLDIAESIGVGLWSQAAGGSVFTFTSAVRAELRREVDRRFPQEVRHLTQLTAQWFLERSDHFNALRYAVEAEDYDLAQQVITQGYHPILRAHRHGIIELLGHLPLRTLRKTPLVTMLLAMALNATGSHQVRAAEMFALAVVSARMMGEKVDPVRRAVLLTIENAALRVIGQAGLSLAAAERTAQHYAGLTLAQKDELAHLAPTLLAHTGLSFFYSGKTREALEHFQASYSLPRRERGAGRLHALSLCAGVHAMDGDIPEALALAVEARSETWADGQREGYIGALYQVAEGMIALEGGDFEKALSHVTVMSPHLETIEHWPLFMHLQSMALLGSGRALEAVTTLTSAMQRGARPSVTPYTRVRLDAIRATLFTAAGQLRSAEDVLKRHPKSSPPIALARARLWLTLGKPEAARQALQPIDGDSLPPRLGAELVLLRAASAMHLNESELALDNLDRALAMLDDRGLRMPIRLLPAGDWAKLRAIAVDAGRESGVLADPHEESMMLMPARQAVHLTEREHIVLQTLATTASAAEIASALFVSANTVKTQLRSLYRKLGASTREEALRRAGEHGILDR